MNFLLKIFKAIFKIIFSNKKIIFLYIPLLVSIFISGYVSLIYFQWQNDKDGVIEKLLKYKKLIDKTEEMREGRPYSYSDSDLSAKVVDIPTRIYDRNNEIIGEFSEEKREIVSYNYIPQWIVKGVVASEDRDFYNHSGINYKGILRAMIKNIINLRLVQGGSTITQQLAKVLFTNMERNIKRKVYEAFCAKEIEKRYDKQDILSMYLNLIYFGNGAYGVEYTSKMFFGKTVNKINAVESAMIVATISNPKYYSPLSNLKNSIVKTRRILKSMTDAGFIDNRKAEYQYQKFLKKWDVVFDENKKAVSSLIGDFVYSSYKLNKAPFFNEYIRRILVKKYGEESLKKSGLSVYTTIDAGKQASALGSLRVGVEKQREYHLKISKRLKNKDKSLKEKKKAENIEGAFIALNPNTGEIIAYAGGYGFTKKNQNDHVRQMRRQPGSSIKPLLYCSAIENREITPSTIFIDEKTVFKGGYTPRNYSGKFEGKMPAREALRMSVNVVAVKVLEKTGYSKIFNYIQKSLNLSDAVIKKRFGKTLSLALGTYELSPIENCTLHSVLVNGGSYISPYGIRYVKDYSGNIIWNNEEKILQDAAERRRKLGNIIDPGAAAITISMLKRPHYYALRVVKDKFEIAGKTGTSTNFNDAWFIGHTSNLVTAVWIGNKTGAISLGRGRSGSSVASPVFGRFISEITRENKPGNFKVPDTGLTIERICRKSGLVAGRNGECSKYEVSQLYYAGSEPGEFCNIHIIQEDEKISEKSE
jgi:membrane carboxypeptidase/penicillin-binding protein